MPVSRSHGFAFVHIPKSAGTSILKALGEITQDTHLDFNERGFLEVLCAHPKRQRILAEINRLYPLHGLVDFPLQHLPARVLRELIGPSRWSQLFSFTFVRNPWDLVVSAYHFQLRELSRPTFAKLEPDRVAMLRKCNTFSHFVNVYSIVEPYDQFELIADEKGEIIVDFVGRFETLQSDFDAICEKLGYPAVSLPRLNGTEHRPYREYYTPETKASVAQFFARSVERFGYEF